MRDYGKESLRLHAKHKGKISVASKVPIKNRHDLSVAYTPGVAEPCRKIAQNRCDVYRYTSKGNMIAVVTDGSAVLGLGDIGPYASLPVMEGKAVLFKRFAGIDAVPIPIDSKDVNDIVRTIKLISPMFGGINIEDISAPRCFEVEDKLKEILDIPFFHDDQHGTAIVVLAGLINAFKVAKKNFYDAKIVVSGVGAAGVATSRLLLKHGARNIILCDTIGAIYKGRTEHMNPIKTDMSSRTNPHNEKGILADVIRNADVFIGVSAPGLLSKEMVKSMHPKAIIFAMANPMPEIMPEDAMNAGAFIIATGRSDYPNQVNNVLSFPGLMKGALDVRAKAVNDEMKIAAAIALAGLVKNPNPKKIIPDPFDKDICKVVAKAVEKAAIKTKVNRI